MIGSDRFGFFAVIGRYTDHHRSPKYRPITDTDQKIGRALAFWNLDLSFEKKFWGIARVRERETEYISIWTTRHSRK